MAQRALIWAQDTDLKLRLLLQLFGRWQLKPPLVVDQQLVGLLEHEVEQEEVEADLLQCPRLWELHSQPGSE